MQKDEALQKLKEREGEKLPPLTVEVEKGLIKRFAEAVGDENPLWQEGVALPTLVLTLGFNDVIESLTKDAPLTVLHGSTELNSLLSIKAGDVLRVESELSKVRVRKGQMGDTAFTTFTVSYINSEGQAVANVKQTAVVY